jgi:hypothetical protein
VSEGARQEAFTSPSLLRVPQGWGDKRGKSLSVRSRTQAVGAGGAAAGWGPCALVSAGAWGPGDHCGSAPWSQFDFKWLTTLLLH